ncbi:MAG TPA: 4-hydroxybenzoate octaprenyltransferase [Persephonella sp.]|uniref:4-hydroxybenzoate polyprenyltransferase n=1 Tax=Persephonella marina (strain DSM 14350 / EX-H1) TaxID=123214 RepID=C0QRD9_PERMH|nr:MULTISPECIES: UbiA-like polyprenyltransferase [Persephonella]ACO03437.1 putative 4-hydroxybenzoate polyprenyltransferase [Persephonella marina EX-H1]HCB68981.1 4-hydroxybenzoate octaprenyltransferase [Persephonella sp.]
MIQKLKLYANLVKFEHTIFAIPFVLASVFILEKGLPDLEKVFWILVAAIAGRTAGMAFNRFFDLPFDRLNPRSKNWVSVTGAVKAGEILALAIVSSGILVFSAYQLNKLAFYLSPIAILLLIIYPLGKRFTNFVHLILGAVYFIIPVAVSVALKGTVEISMIFLGLGMAFWVAGFDIFYALQDVEFDRKVGVHSIPARFGIKRAIIFARIFHFLTFVFLVLTGIYADLGSVYFFGLIVLTGFLVYEHSLIKENDLSKINVAFFTVNGYVSVLYMVFVITDIYL